MAASTHNLVFLILFFFLLLLFFRDFITNKENETLSPPLLLPGGESVG
jgi:hypothetical protein